MLRDLVLEDAPFLYEIFHDETSTQYWLVRVQSLDEMKYHLKVNYLSYRQKGLPCPQVIVFENKVIGLCWLNELDDGVGRVEFILHKDYEHRGLMSKALSEYVKRGFDELDLHRIEALVFQKNVKSKRTLERCHFVFEGTLRSYLNVNGQLWDVDLYSLIKEDL